MVNQVDSTASNKGWRSLDLTLSHSAIPAMGQMLSPNQVRTMDSNGMGVMIIRPPFRTQRSSSVPVQQNHSQQQNRQQIENVSPSKVRYSLAAERERCFSSLQRVCFFVYPHFYLILAHLVS